jgi:8-oxo-dGTP diphosphatase
MTVSGGRPAGQEHADIACVGAVAFDDSGRLLLVKRANPPAQGLWSIPGGRVEPGESAEIAVVREVLEETGLSVTIVREVGTVYRDAPSGGRYVIRDFLVEPAAGAVPFAGDDADDARFFTVADLAPDELSPGLLEALRDWDLIHRER